MSIRVSLIFMSVLFISADTITLPICEQKNGSAVVKKGKEVINYENNISIKCMYLAVKD